MKMIRSLAIAGALGAALVANTASAQNVGNNAGIWWNPVAGQPSSFTFLNPVTTMYFRVGLLHSWQGESGYSHTVFPGVPVVFPGQSLNAPNAWGGTLGIGARLMPVLRYELQLGGTFNTQTTVDIAGFASFLRFRSSSVQLMNNLYLDIAPFFGNSLWGLNPYLMAGIGVSWNTTSDQVQQLVAPFGGTGTTRTNFAWNLGVGLQWQVMNNLILDVGYRYLDAGRFQNNFNIAVGAAFSTRYDNTSHQVLVGVVVPFAGLIRGFGN